MEIDATGPFGDVLKELRNRKKLSRPKLGQRLQISPSTIEKWERGDVLPDRARVEELIHAMDLSEAERLLLLEAHAGHRILPSVHNLPADRNPYFTARAEILMQLDRRLAPGSQVALTQAISGLGGIGKTQVALEYVYRYQKRHSHLFWVTADSRETLTTEFNKLARDLDLSEKDEKDQMKAVQAVQRWLREYLDWVLVFDNIEDLGLVSEFVPTGHLGAVLLTTRRQVTEPVAQVLELDVFAEDDGVLFLLKRARRLLVLDGAINEAQASEVEVARAITQLLGGLPLALDQAGAYIVETGCGLSDYLDLFKQRQTSLLQRRGVVPGGHPQSVTTTFSLAFEQVQQKNKVASEILKLCTFLAPDSIPEEILTADASSLGPMLSLVATDPLQLDQAAEVLRAYSLIRRNPTEKTLSIHRLVQAVFQDILEEIEERTWREQALRAVSVAFPHVEPETWPQCERLLMQALFVTSSIEQDQTSDSKAGRLLYETASYLQYRGRYTEAESLYWQSLHIRELQLGPDHPDVANSLNNLAALYWDRGRYTEAEPLYLRALHIWEQILGPKSSDEAYMLNNLAILYQNQGKYAEAEPLYLRALHIWEQILGPDHPDGATALHNLAELYSEQGKYAEAELLYQRALRIWEQILGPESSRVAYPLDGLANLSRQQGKYAEAEPLYQRALRIREQQLGLEHPYVAYTLTELANLYNLQGRHEEAEPLYQRALAIREQELGRGHIETAETIYGLATLREAQNHYQETLALYQRALAIRERVLGSEHPKTRAIYQHLITLRQSTSLGAGVSPQTEALLEEGEQNEGYR